jgi:hypothetical protein
LNHLIPEIGESKYTILLSQLSVKAVCTMSAKLNIKHDLVVVGAGKYTLSMKFSVSHIHCQDGSDLLPQNTTFNYIQMITSRLSSQPVLLEERGRSTAYTLD